MTFSVSKLYSLSLLLLGMLVMSGTKAGLESETFTPAYPAKQNMDNNEHQRSETVRDLRIPGNPLRLNGHPLDYSQFSIHSQGELTVVVGNRNTEAVRTVPFQVHVQRNGEIVQDFASGFTGEARVAIDLGLVLARSQPGDQLIIHPYWKKHGNARRVLKILDSPSDELTLGC
uniref:Uncharacterized protein n=1 Tax=Roseihalotalea indica TaxID=2867963 RepID=A0AA49GMM1_9BACT|nr:hypothetical protein K4G66_29800 [Tunicatimonas sp. TK19036]